MKIVRVYTGDDGKSHFEDVELSYGPKEGSGSRTELEAATGIIFRETSGDYDLDWHTAPRRQYIINLDAGVEITVSDGETRVIGAGEVFLVEDVTGKGHMSKSVDGKPRHCIFVPID